jgi:hypothetical protein
MAGRLSPSGSQRRELARSRGFTLSDRVTLSDRRGNRRRSADSCRADRQFSKEVSA